MSGTILRQIVRSGTLTVMWPDGRADIYGAGLPLAAIRIQGRRSPWTIGIRPDLVFGEAYMDGRVTVEEGTIADVLEILLSNMGAGAEPWLLKARSRVRRCSRAIAQFNPARRAQKNVVHH